MNLTIGSEELYRTLCHESDFPLFFNTLACGRLRAVIRTVDSGTTIL